MCEINDNLEHAAVLKERIRAKALELGFDAFGVTAAQKGAHGEKLVEWLKSGAHADMEWMQNAVERRIDPSAILPEARSVIVVGINYYNNEPDRLGKIATYALGGDYHKLLNSRLKQLCAELRNLGAEISRPYADTGPVMEKPLAALAGLGWQGKHTNLVNRKLGNWLFLGTIITTLPLPPDTAEENHCGSCTRCINACPTGAITGPYRLDARRCISYLTIEHRGPIPLEMRPLIGDHLYGCDECLAACPWNKWAKVTSEERFTPRPLPTAQTMLLWTQEDFDTALAGMAIRRCKLEGLRRNCCIVLGNTGKESDLPLLQKAATDENATVAECASWAASEIEKRIKPQS